MTDVRLRRLLGPLHGAVPALCLASEDALPAAREREALSRAGKERRGHDGQHGWKYPYSVGETFYAWLPWVILIACCALWGTPAQEVPQQSFPSIKFNTRCSARRSAARCRCRSGTCRRCTTWCSGCRRSRPSTRSRRPRDSSINWLSAAGTGVFVAAHPVRARPRTDARRSGRKRSCRPRTG